MKQISLVVTCIAVSVCKQFCAQTWFLEVRKCSLIGVSFFTLEDPLPLKLVLGPLSWVGWGVSVDYFSESLFEIIPKKSTVEISVRLYLQPLHFHSLKPFFPCSYKDIAGLHNKKNICLWEHYNQLLSPPMNHLIWTLPDFKFTQKKWEWISDFLKVSIPSLPQEGR